MSGIHITDSNISGASACSNCNQFISLEDPFVSKDGFLRRPVGEGQRVNISTVFGTIFSTSIKAEGWNEQEDESGESWNFCKHCSTVLMDLYNIYSEFLKLCHQESLVFGKYLRHRILQEGFIKVEFDDAAIFVGDALESEFISDSKNDDEDEELEQNELVGDTNSEISSNLEDSIIEGNKDSNVRHRRFRKCRNFISNKNRSVKYIESDSEDSDGTSTQKRTRKRGRPRKSLKLKSLTDDDQSPPPKRKRGRPAKFPFEKSKNKQLYKCPEDGCTKEANSRWNLALHIKCVHEKSRPFSCSAPSCGKRFFSKHALNIHNQRFHLEESLASKFVCKEPGCGRSFAYPAGLRTHQFDHKPKDNLPFSCGVCGKKFKRNCDLEDHMARHTNDRPFVCDRCASCFKTNKSLVSHQTSQHSEKRLSSCDICGKVLKNRANLRHHIQNVHEGVKNHSCDICTKSFSSLGNLRTHIKSQHPHQKDNTEEASIVVNESVLINSDAGFS